MTWLIPAISIGFGFKLAIAVILFVRYFETKEESIFWWAIGWFFFGLRDATQLIITATKFEPLWFIHHVIWAFISVAFIESIGYMRRAVLKISHMASAVVGIGSIISSYIAIFVINELLVATISTSFLNSLAFIGCAFYFIKFTKEKKVLAKLPVFLGFFLIGLHSLSSPILEPIAWFAPFSFGLGIIFAIIFASGLIMMTTEALQRQREESQRLIRSLFLFDTVAATVEQSLNLEEILRNVLDRVLEMMGAEVGVVYLLDEKKEELNLKVQRGFSEESIPQIEKLRLDKDTITGRMVLAGEPVILADVSEIPSAKKTTINKEKLKSFMGIPLKSRDKMVGAMNIISRDKGLFYPEDVKLLSSIGNAIGVAIENARLYETIKNWNIELEKTVEERTKDLNEARRATLNMLEDINQAYKELKETQAQLVRRERLAAIGQMATVLSHELRNVFAGIQTGAYNLKRKAAKDFPALVGSLQDIEEEVNYASNILANILSFTHPRKLVLGEADINLIIEDVLSSPNLQEMFKNNNIQIAKELDFSLPKIKADGIQIKEVILNLAINAVQAMPNGGRLSLISKRQAESLRLEVTDTGEGIPKEVLENLFTPFFTTKSRGLGLGLCICKEIVEAHQGKIEVQTEINKGSTFIISLPLV